MQRGWEVYPKPWDDNISPWLQPAQGHFQEKGEHSLADKWIGKRVGDAEEFVCPLDGIPGVREKETKHRTGKKDARRVEKRGMEQQD